MADDLTPYDRRILDGPVGAFGKYLMERSYDVGMRSAGWTLDGRLRAGARMQLTERLARLNDDQREAVMLLVQAALIDSLHGLLHGLSQDDDAIRLLFDGSNVAELSDGLHGDLFLFLSHLSAYPYESDLGLTSGDDGPSN